MSVSVSVRVNKAPIIESDTARHNVGKHSCFTLQLCSSARLVPESYLEFKRMLIHECNKQGYLKLMHARNIVKIDVNKTRKVYDFLLQEGHINKDAMM